MMLGILAARTDLMLRRKWCIKLC